MLCAHLSREVCRGTRSSSQSPCFEGEGTVGEEQPSVNLDGSWPAAWQQGGGSSFPFVSMGSF